MKKTILILATALIGFGGISQDYFHKLGLSINLYGEREISTSGETGSSFTGLMPMVTYQAGLNFEIGDILYFSPTAYPALGSGILSVNGAYGGDLFAFNLPIVAELFIGEDREYFGGFIGAGFDYSYYSSIGSIMGPQFSGGLNFNFEDTFLENYFGESAVTLRFSYTIPINKPDQTDLGTNVDRREFMPNYHIQLLYDLGY
ncbi:hypothetical protein N9544_05065 [Flavobacteriales bacterium]|nr:hypothetical protein [Flavobacteriales bacterium]